VKKISAYAGLTALVIGVRALLQGVPRQSLPELHVLLEITAGLIALMVMKMALVRYYSRRADRFLMLGVGFLGSGLLDLYHGLAGSSLFARGGGAEVWGWPASRLFLLVFLLGACVVCKASEDTDDGRLDQRLVYAGASGLLLTLFAVLAFAPLPAAQPALQRTLELASGLLFLLLLGRALAKGFWRTGTFDHFLVLSLLSSFFGQTLFLALAADPADVADPLVLAGHVAKILACLFVVAGLLGDMFTLFRRADRTAVELARAYAALQAEEHQRTRAEEERDRFFDLSVDLLCIAGMDGSFRQLSRAWEKVLGWSLDELKARPLLDLVHPDDLEATRRESQRLRMGGAVVDFENRYVTREGGWRWLAWRAVAVPDKGLIYSVARDISERKRIEQMKNDFVAVVSHELRTPLTSIRGSLGLLGGGVAGELPEKARTLVDIATKNSDRLVRLINDILDVEKIESGEMGFRLVPQDLMALVEQAVEENQTYGQPYGITLRVAEGARTLVRADGDRLRQVLNNLLSNAVKFSPRDGVVTVGVTARDGRARLSVTDRGKGIPPEFQARIFEKFTQADATSTRQRGGTGLGLSISKAIVERHGGEIWFETAAGLGTTFFVELPLWLAAPLPVLGHPVAAAALGEGERAFRGFDEELGRRMIGEDGDAAAEGGGELDAAKALVQS
jgi:PAS domain S-box-containing protein